MLLVGVAALLMLVMLAGPLSVSRAVADDAGVCNHASGDEAIAACTRAIDSGSWRGPDLALAYDNRGNAYLAKGDNDRAVADYDEAIRLYPEYAFAYNGRGNAYQGKRDNDRAKGDYNRARGDNDRALAD
jgi:tetratricopeptide (TPR) repeat protein